MSVSFIHDVVAKPAEARVGGSPERAPAPVMAMAREGGPGGDGASGSGAWPAGVDFGALARELPDVVLVLDMERLEVRDVNRGPEGAFGFTRDELLARDGFALFPRWWDAEKTLRRGAAVATFVKQKTGDEAPVDIRMSPARLGDGREVIVACVREGRPLSEIERELADANTYLHAIVENIPDMIFVKDAENHAFRRFNRAGEELLGFSRGELLGKTDDEAEARADGAQGGPTRRRAGERGPCSR